MALQPQIDAATGALSGCEAPRRWHHPTRGTIPPAVFVPLAEDLNLIADIDQAVLTAALDAKSALVVQRVEIPKISVKVSARRVSSSDLLSDIETCSDISDGSRAFEILETAFLVSIDGDQPEALRARGVRIEVDDFGTGHASLAAVLARKPDVLKVDRIFVPAINVDPAKQDLMLGLI